MVFNYSSEWASAILHVKTNGIKCTSFTYFCSWTFSFYVRFWLWISCWHISLTKTCWRQNFLLQKALESKFPSELSIFDWNSELELALPWLPYWPCAGDPDIRTWLMTILTYHYVFSSMFSSWKTFWYEMTDIQLDQPTGIFHMWFVLSRFYKPLK